MLTRAQFFCSHPAGRDRSVFPTEQAFVVPDEVHLDKIDATDEEWFCRMDEEDYISSKKKGRNLLAKKDVAEIAVDPADLDPEDIEAMQFVKQFIEKNPENIDALMLANTILRAMELMNGKMIKRAPLVIEPGREIPTSLTRGNATSLPATWTCQRCDLQSIAKQIKTELINALHETSCP